MVEFIDKADSAIEIGRWVGLNQDTLGKCPFKIKKQIEEAAKARQTTLNDLFKSEQ